MMFLLFENKLLRRIIPRYFQCHDESNKLLNHKPPNTDMTKTEADNNLGSDLGQ